MFDRGILFSQEYGKLFMTQIIFKPSNKSSKYQNQPDLQSMIQTIISLCFMKCMESQPPLMVPIHIIMNDYVPHESNWHARNIK